MKLRPVQYGDGVQRVTIRVEQRLSRDELVSLLAGWAAVYGADDELTATGVWDTLRQHLTEEGRDAVHALANNPDVDDADEATVWAAAQVARIWPADAPSARR